MIKFLSKRNSGYALMFTVIVVSIISLIAIGLSNATYKQILLASIARDSQTAFYKADTILECIEYEDNVHSRFSTLYLGSLSFNCGLDDTGAPYVLPYTYDAPSGVYTVKLDTSWDTKNSSCFSGKVTKTIVGQIVNTEILGSGYNICNKANTRTVERTIKANY